MSCSVTISFIFLSVIYSCQRHEAIPDSLARALTARSVFQDAQGNLPRIDRHPARQAAHSEL